MGVFLVGSLGEEMPKRSRSSSLLKKSPTKPIPSKQEQKQKEEDLLIENEPSKEEQDSEASDEDSKYVEEQLSDDELLPLDENTVGDIPMRWYDEYDHIGYNIVGDQIARPQEKNQREVILTDHEVKVLRNIQKARYPDPDYDPY